VRPPKLWGRDTPEYSQDLDNYPWRVEETWHKCQLQRVLVLFEDSNRFYLNQKISVAKAGTPIQVLAGSLSGGKKLSKASRTELVL